MPRIDQLETALKTTGKAVTYNGLTTPRIRLDSAALPPTQPTYGALSPSGTFANFKDYAIPDPGSVDSPIVVSDLLGMTPLRCTSTSPSSTPGWVT